MPADAATVTRVLEVVATMVSADDLHEHLLRLTQAAAELADARYAALGVLQPDSKDLAEFIVWGVDDQVRQRIGPLPHGHGVLGQLTDDPRPLRLADLSQHPASVGTPAHHPAMTSFLGVPIRVRGTVFGNLYLADKRSAAEFTERDEQVVTSLAAAAGVTLENARLYDESRRRASWLTAATDVTADLLGGAPAEQTAQLLVTRAAQIAAADEAMLLVRDEPGRLTVEACCGTQLEHLRGRHLPDGPDPLPPGGPCLLLPLNTPHGPIGYLAVRRVAGSAPFEAERSIMVECFAGQAALAVDYARAVTTRQRLAVLEDRERIAADLHDLVIQRIFAVGMSLQGLSAQLTDPQLRSRVEAQVDDLDATIRDIRTAIFSLQRPGPAAGSGLRTQVIDELTHATPALKVEPELSFSGPVDTLVPPDVAADLLAVLREGLSNVARHAGAQRVRVSVTADTGGVLLQIEDDGVGGAEHAPSGQGRRSMQARAARHGGSFVLQAAAISAPPAGGNAAGTVLRWQVPLSHSGPVG